ncbi:hypothetical protein B0H10DRAFT_2084086 [Mycena sp. CBHHK59/15]|nr:hypothetical protein B0H10DRAFT_2084086 [Mycena sp. CBHHK59/15]
MANRTSTPSICQLTPPTPATAPCTHRQNQHHNSLRADQHPLDIPTSQTTSNPSNERAGMTTHNHDSMIPIQPTNQPTRPSIPPYFHPGPTRYEELAILILRPTNPTS